MKTLPARLRNHADEVLDPGYPYYGTPEMVRDAADEIERLRLTDEERHAIAVVRNCAMTRAERFLTQSDAEREATLVLWRLRERLG